AAVIIALLGFALRWVQKKVSGKRDAARVAEPQPSGWVWPMPRAADGSPPVISDGWGSPRDRGARRHAGVDVMYRRDHVIPKGGKVPPHESRGFYVPQGTTVLAAAPGKVWS